MHHRFFLEDDLIKVGWGSESTLQEWDAILVWVLRTLQSSDIVLHILMDFSDIYVLSPEMFHPRFAEALAAHPRAGKIMLVSNNPVFVHFVNEHWITQAEEKPAPGIRAFLDVSDALSWLRDKSL